ncbi:MAG: hypothetical protein ABS876_06155, partial [Ruminococcus sp.]
RLLGVSLGGGIEQARVTDCQDRWLFKTEPGLQTQLQTYSPEQIELRGVFFRPPRLYRGFRGLLSGSQKILLQFFPEARSGNCTKKPEGGQQMHDNNKGTSKNSLPRISTESSRHKLAKFS